jgi:hypothetical protein
MRWWPRLRAKSRTPAVRPTGGTAPAPLVRTTTSIQLVAGDRKIASRRRDHRLTEPTLVHGRDPLAPSGHVLGLAHPVPPRRRRRLPLVWGRRNARRSSAPQVSVTGSDTEVTPLDNEAPESILTQHLPSASAPPGDFHAPLSTGKRRPSFTRRALRSGFASPIVGSPRRIEEGAPTHSQDASTSEVDQASIQQDASRRAEDRPHELPPVPLVGTPAAPFADRAQPVPSELRTAIERRFGVQLPEVTVRRDAASSDAVTSLRARAATSGKEIHLPPRHGATGTTSADALTVHELVHVAQQQIRGPDMPAEDSPFGRILEHQATEMERIRKGPYSQPARAGRSVPSAHSPNIPPSAPAAGPPAPPPSLGNEVRRAPIESEGGVTPSAVGSTSEDPFERLYARIRGRLRHELIIDRERAGLLSGPD